MGEIGDNQVAGLDDHPGRPGMGTDPTEMAEATSILVDMGYDVIDVNFACPVKKIKRRSRGGHFLANPADAIEVLASVRRAAGDVPVSVKLRRGWDDTPEMTACFERLFDATYDLGCAWATVHCRTVQQRYIGPGRWEFLRDLRRRHPDRIFFGSGDVWTVEDIFAMLELTGVSAVSVARGCIGHPWIFRQARAMLAGRPPADPTLSDQRETLTDHLEYARVIHGERVASRQMRKFGIKFGRHPQAAEVKKAFIAAESMAAWSEVIDRFIHGSRSIVGAGSTISRSIVHATRARTVLILSRHAHDQSPVDRVRGQRFRPVAFEAHDVDAGIEPVPIENADPDASIDPTGLVPLPRHREGEDRRHRDQGAAESAVGLPRSLEFAIERVPRFDDGDDARSSDSGVHPRTSDHESPPGRSPSPSGRDGRDARADRRRAKKGGCVRIDARRRRGRSRGRPGRPDLRRSHRWPRPDRSRSANRPLRLGRSAPSRATEIGVFADIAKTSLVPHRRRPDVRPRSGDQCPVVRECDRLAESIPGWADRGRGGEPGSIDTTRIGRSTALADSTSRGCRRHSRSIHRSPRRIHPRLGSGPRSSRERRLIDPTRW